MDEKLKDISYIEIKTAFLFGSFLGTVVADLLDSHGLIRAFLSGFSQ